MRIKKRVYGKIVVLDFVKVKKYPAGFTLYDVFCGNRFLYKTCFTPLQVKELTKCRTIFDEEDLDLCM